MSNVSQHAFSEKVALVVGGDTPVGKAVSLQLALCGAYVVVTAEDLETSSLGQLKEMGTLASSLELSGIDANGAGRIAGHVREKFGRIDLLVNCVTEASSDEVFSREFEKTVDSAFLIIKACLPLAEDRPKFRIVNVFPDGNGLSSRVIAAAGRELVSELARSTPENVFVNGVRYVSGDAKVEPDDGLFSEGAQRNADDIARVVFFLLSGEAKALNGQTLEAG